MYVTHLKGGEEKMSSSLQKHRNSTTGSIIQSLNISMSKSISMIYLQSPPWDRKWNQHGFFWDHSCFQPSLTDFSNEEVKCWNAIGGESASELTVRTKTMFVCPCLFRVYEQGLRLFMTEVMLNSSNNLSLILQGFAITDVHHYL